MCQRRRVLARFSKRTLTRTASQSWALLVHECRCLCRPSLPTAPLARASLGEHPTAESDRSAPGLGSDRARSSLRHHFGGSMTMAGGQRSRDSDSLRRRAITPNQRRLEPGRSRPGLKPPFQYNSRIQPIDVSLP